MTSKPQGGWQFVNISEPKRQKKDEAIRKVIRANAMRDFRRKQKEERLAMGQACRKPSANEGRRVRHPDRTEELEELTTVSQHPIPRRLGDKPARDEPVVMGDPQLLQLARNLDLTSLAELTNKDEEQLVEQEEQHTLTPAANVNSICNGGVALSQNPSKAKSPSNPRTFLDSGTDPFNASPVIVNRRYTKHLIHHFANVIAQNCLPLESDVAQNPLVNFWLPFAMYDPALFFSTLNYAVIHIDILTGHKSTLELLSYKDNAIRTINKRLQSPEDALTDSTIGSVAMLAATASIQANYKELKIHMNALKKMVNIRGGLQELCAVLHMFISWQDLLSATVLTQPPVYAMTACSATLSDNLPLDTPNQPLYPVLGLSDPLVSKHLHFLFNDLSFLTTTVNQQNIHYGRPKWTTIDLMTFSKNRTVIEHRILNMARSSAQKPRAVMTQDDYTLELCRLAALVFIKCGLHMFLPMSSILVAVKQQVTTLILDQEKYRADGVTGETQSGCVLWGLCVSSILAMTPEEEDFFANRIALITRAFGGWSWSDMETLLRQIAWVDKLRTPVCKSVWARVEALNAKEYQRQAKADIQSQAMMEAATQWLGGEYANDFLDNVSD